MSDDSGPASAVDHAADCLYGLDPDQFVAARDEIAKTLRRDDTAAAKAVKALRRPTVAAWSVNQLVRRHPEMVDELLDATRRLDEAQRETLTGKHVDLRKLSERRQELMDELSARTVRIIEEAGRSPSAHQDDIVRTLQATSDPDLARELRRGRLSAALEPVSALSGLTTWFEESGAAEAASNRDRQRGLERAAEEAEAALFAAERDLATTQSELSRLQVQLRDATLQVEQLTRLCDQRRDELAGAHKALADETA